MLRLAACLLGLWSIALPALASPQLAVLPFQGPASAAERAALEEATVKGLSARRGFSVIAPWDVGPQLKQAGVSRKDPKLVARAGQAVGAVMILQGTAGPRATTLVLFDASAGLELAHATYPKGKARARQIAATVFDRLRKGILVGERLALSAPPPVASALPPAVEAPAPPPAAGPIEAPPTEASAAGPAPAPAAAGAPTAAVETPPPAQAVERSPPGPVVFELSAAGGSLTRQLSYSQDIFGSLGGYTLRAGALLGGDIAFYPLALATRDFWANFGIVGTFSHTLGVSSSLTGGTSYPTDADRWGFGLRVRLALNPIELGITAGYGREEFRLGTPPGAQPPPIPDYANGFVPVALDLRWTVAPAFAVLANGGYLFVIDDGIANSAFFPHAAVAGVTAGLGVGVAIIPQLELRLAADYQRFFYSFNSVPADTQAPGAHVAGGAVDQYLEGTLALAVQVR